MSRDNDSWVAELQSKQESALTDLRAALLRNLRKALSNRFGDDDSFLEDTVQDAILRILERIDQFEGRSKFLTWATTIAIHLAMKELRRSRWKDVSLDDVVSHAGLLPRKVIDPQAPPDTQIERQSLLLEMDRVIQEDLTHKQRIALLAELKGMPQQEIAHHLGSNRNAVYKLTHDARKKLKAGLEAAGYTTADLTATTMS
ncbi:MAG: sigma-70 family RNA polymerase sigma factor [Planctomycetaceae bacterium]|nr:sigma-70 family RNA polymerase sigma factor [Planctomycetaceae bacterium]